MCQGYIGAKKLMTRILTYLILLQDYENLLKINLTMSFNTIDKLQVRKI